MLLLIEFSFYLFLGALCQAQDPSSLDSRTGKSKRVVKSRNCLSLIVKVDVSAKCITKKYMEM